MGGRRGDRGEAARVGETRERRLALGERAVGAGDRDPRLRGAARARGRAAPDRSRVRDALEQRGVVELLDGDPADVGVGIAARDGSEALLVVRPISRTAAARTAGSG